MGNGSGPASERRAFGAGKRSSAEVLQSAEKKSESAQSAWGKGVEVIGLFCGALAHLVRRAAPAQGGGRRAAAVRQIRANVANPYVRLSLV